jgi:hypothetical protein
MPLAGSSKQQLVNLPSNGIDNQEDAYALAITYRGRDWIVLFTGSGQFTAFPADHRKSNIHQARKVMEYLKVEGFINPEDDKPIMSVQ